MLLFGVSFFLKYAFDNEWINETSRTILGALAGMALVGGGLRLARGGLDTFGHALIGTGLAILYLVVYSALNFYALIDRSAAFVLMSLTTVTAAFVADSLRSQPLAFIAVGGGFLTPALIGGTEITQLRLFTFEAVLVLGTLLLSLRHHWLALNALSYLATLFTVGAWLQRYYSDHRVAQNAAFPDALLRVFPDHPPCDTPHAWAFCARCARAAVHRAIGTTLPRSSSRPHIHRRFTFI